jgi:thiosulfate dehydrogenase (quinone) large subunit
MESNKFKAVLGILRISMGLIFLWAFFDKTFGLGFATTAEKAWLAGKPEAAWMAGGSPTTGFLQFGVHGPFADFFHSLAGNGTVDWLFMLGLLFIGISLTFGIFMKLGGWSGILMLFLMYLAVGIQPEHHPFIDDHFMYIFTILILMWSHSGKYLGFGNVWYNSSLVQKYKILA